MRCSVKYSVYWPPAPSTTEALAAAAASDCLGSTCSQQKAVAGETPNRDSRAILLAILSLQALAEEDPIDRVNFNAAFSLAFAGFIRLGEITYKDADLKDLSRLRAEKVRRQRVTCLAAQDYLTVHLPRSKTDYSNQDTDIRVAVAGDTALRCAGRHMPVTKQHNLLVTLQ
jgi:hypothetical protein